MKKWIFAGIAVLAGVMVVTACSKKDEETADPSKGRVKLQLQVVK